MLLVPLILQRTSDIRRTTIDGGCQSSVPPSQSGLLNVTSRCGANITHQHVPIAHASPPPPQAFIDKFRYNAKRASLVQSRIKALERMAEVQVRGPLAYPTAASAGRQAGSVARMA